MAHRWIGLARRRATRSRFSFSRFCRESARAMGAAGVLLMSSALNFAMYPDALARAMETSAEVVGFIDEAPGLEPNVPESVILNEDEVRLLAATAWAEARSEGEDGMRAVAHVIVNRVGLRFGETVEDVIRAPWQFSAWNRGDPNQPLAQNPERYATGGINLETWEIAQRVAREVLAGQSVDPTDGALFYHTTAIRPWWSRYGEGRREIGAHVFYRDVPNQTRRARVTPVSATFAPPIAAETQPLEAVASAAEPSPTAQTEPTQTAPAQAEPIS
jgi:spore germination cell wall hydrolase CwlJ-like protein